MWYLYYAISKYGSIVLLHVIGFSILTNRQTLSEVPTDDKNTMKVIKVHLDGKTVGVLPAFDERDTLSNLRNEIREDFGLIDFCYLRESLPINLSTETFVEVGSVTKCEGENNDCLSIELTSSAVLSQSKNDAGFSSACHDVSFVSDASLAVDQSDDDEIFTETQLQSDSSKLKQPNTPTSMFLRSPSSWEVRGVKIYTSQEIESAKGMEKQRRIFWNDMAKKLCKETKNSKQVIAQIINESWRKEQTGLLITKSKDLLDAAKEMEKTNSKMKPSTIAKNIQRIRDSQKELERIDAEMKEALEQSPLGDGINKRKRELEELQRAKKYHLSDIKKGQDAMRKNLNLKLSEVKNLMK